MRTVSQRVRLPQNVLRALEIALQTADLADRVQAVRHDRDGLELFKLLGRPPEFLLRALPAPLEGRDLRAVDPAYAWKTTDRFGLAPAVGQLDPLRRPSVIREVAAGGDHLACRDARGQRRQLAVHGRDR